MKHVKQLEKVVLVTLLFGSMYILDFNKILQQPYFHALEHQMCYLAAAV